MKKWYQSKTIWASILLIVASLISGCADLLSGEIILQELLEEILGACFGIAGIIIRFKTTERLER
jgi:hypothetical protein